MDKDIEQVRKEHKENELTDVITSSCFDLLKKNKKLIVLTFINWASAIIFSVFFVCLINIIYKQNFFYSIDTSNLSDYFSTNFNIGYLLNNNNWFSLALVFIFFLALYTIITYFNNAIILSVYEIINKEKLSIKQSLKNSLGNIYNIFILSLWLAIGRFITELLLKNQKTSAGVGTDLGIGITAYFASVIVAIEKTTVSEAMKKSIKIMIKTWPENFGSQVKFFFVFAPYYFAVFVAAMIFFGSFHASPILIKLANYLIAVAFLGIFIVSTTVGTIFRTVLYVYADSGKLVEGFEKESLVKAFVSKNEIKEN